MAKHPNMYVTEEEIQTTNTNEEMINSTSNQKKIQIMSA